MIVPGELSGPGLLSSSGFLHPTNLRVLHNHAHPCLGHACRLKPWMFRLFEAAMASQAKPRNQTCHNGYTFKHVTPCLAPTVILCFCRGRFNQHQPKGNNCNPNRDLMQHLYCACVVTLLSATVGKARIWHLEFAEMKAEVVVIAILRAPN